jgi:YVTN family beta-propeller protein
VDRLVRRTLSLTAAAALALSSLLTACSGGKNASSAADANATSTPSTSPTLSLPPDDGRRGAALPPFRGTASTRNIYAADAAGMLSPAVAGQRSLVYVPNHGAGTVSVIDPATFKVIDTYATGGGPQHVIPSWDLKTLYAANDEGGNSLTPIDPRTGKRAGPNLPVTDPYNMYFTPDGSYAIVVEEANEKLTFRDPHTFAVHDSTKVDCAGVDHIDFSADGSYFLATCEFSGRLVKIDTASHAVLGYLDLGKNAMPQDIKLDPAGEIFYVADMTANGLEEVDGASMRQVGFLPTGPETHGLYPSRDGSVMYVSNRGGRTNQGSVSVVNFNSRTVVATWTIPAPSTPDMGGVSADGSTLWLSGRRNNEVYAFDTATGKLRARIPVGTEPHGLAVWPQPGRYSLGHTGILR